MKKTIILILLFNMIVQASSINIAVAANVSYAINDLIKEFNKENPNTKIRLTLGSSGKLTAQIKNGAPYDIFMSANMDYPISLYNDKIAISEPKVYAEGTLAILTTRAIDLSHGINIIKDNSIKRVAIANPKSAPYGKATLEAIKNSKLYENIKNKFVYAESISQTVSYTITAADIGFIAKSSLFSPKMSMYKERVNWIEVDTKLYSPIKQGIVLLKNSQNSTDAKAFYNFVLGEKAKMIFKKFGYLI